MVELRIIAGESPIAGASVVEEYHINKEGKDQQD